ncbi:MAG: type IV pilin N-terminal domain-containing protein, partial [Euryarchaeota archaeon]|nr:type IV pilin N-terminal domain-containing protein [Euryarchaeota archaeon]
MGLPRLIRSNSAVSEVMGTILLLMINVGLFSVVAISVYNLLPFNPAPSADIICQVNGDNIILTHQGGDALSLDTKIGFSNNTGTKYIVVGDYLDEKSKEDGKWSVGEKIVYSNFNLLENQIRVMVIDPSSNSFILSATVPMVNSITVTTLDATGITMNSANLLMNYDLRTQSGSVRFTYCPNDGPWTNTSWISPSGSGSYNIIINSLSPVKLYYFKAQLLYNSTIIEGEQKSYTTLAIANNPPTVTTPDPTNGSTGISITTALLSITIQDPEGDLFNWTITTTPNIGSNTGTTTSNGTKTCTIAGL